jgi:Aspartyl protease
MPTISIPVQLVIRIGEPPAPIRRFHHARTALWVQNARGDFAECKRAIIDTGASYTAMSATLARSMGIPFPSAVSVVSQTAATGVNAVHVHDGELRVRFPQLPGHTFRLYCLFVEETPPNVPLLIGLHDTLEVFRLAFDGRPAADAPAGRVVLETV